MAIKRRSPQSGEFEDRQEIEKDIPYHQFEVEEIPDEEFFAVGLGDLTDDILRERGEDVSARGDIVPYQGGLNPPATTPPDMKFIAGVDEDVAREGVEGTVSQGANVRSTYDARPINARDFISTNEFTVPAGS